MTEQDHLIHFLCTAPRHRRSLELGLTRHQGQWAFCPDLLSQDHEWEDIGGLEPRDAVARWQEMVGASRRAAA